MRSFASDNHSGVHPKVMEAIARANQGHALAYGEDSVTAEADALLHRHFGQHIDTYFVFLGTASNVLGLRAVARSHHAVLCADTAHINVDECGAPEAMAGFKLRTVPSRDGKIEPRDLEQFLADVGVQHHNQPRVVSITQSTELGTLYTPDEVRALADFAHGHGLLLHMDGARLANAAAALGLGLGDISGACGVDVLSFGGTKNGLMHGEAVIFFDARLSTEFRYIRKQNMQLCSKMRFIATQFTALLTDDLWRENAMQSNRMAALLAEKVRDLPGVRITRPVQANAVFAVIPQRAVAPLQACYPFYVWNHLTGEVRWMTSFDTTPVDVDGFVEALRKAVRD
ncbi:threonine aldolase family protein [Desulfocurvibacter africanus]|uniref:Threonine aldolase n=1 Tax=Desulfocurvibacter africanus subsp. africanus str. Walvis Bay TaxID=690850 RepID=F3YVV8_DESAF|nr:aminotransferase class I/II-fold pyridoxal phosphate-dependent enzyme [Desulfocurvibacter africanus]EGJ48916.1 Threonine aldolase [Desulfocurvibacter africanus subsp. africanus str. Walvis Bay]